MTDLECKETFPQVLPICIQDSSDTIAYHEFQNVFSTCIR